MIRAMYLRKKNAEIVDASEEIERLQHKVEKMPGAERDAFEPRFAELRLLDWKAREALRMVREADPESWGRGKDEVESRFAELSRALEEVAGLLRRRSA